MIIFGNKKTLQGKRLEPTEYDWIIFDFQKLLTYHYHDFHKIEKPFSVGFMYHIILYKRKYVLRYNPLKLEMETFDACLIDPFDYCEYMAASGFSGWLGKKSSHSYSVRDMMLELIKGDGHLDALEKELAKNGT